jgi:hypothetical protein
MTKKRKRKKKDRLVGGSMWIEFVKLGMVVISCALLVF